MAGPIHIRYVRSGGFAGLRAAADVDTGVLARSDADKAKQLTLLAQSVLSESAPATPKRPRADGFTYQLTIEHDGQRREIQASEPITSAALQQLIAALDELAQPTR